MAGGPRVREPVVTGGIPVGKFEIAQTALDFNFDAALDASIPGCSRRAAGRSFAAPSPGSQPPASSFFPAGTVAGALTPERVQAFKATVRTISGREHARFISSRYLSDALDIIAFFAGRF